MFGNESADAGNYQVGIRVAHALGRPCVTGLKGIAVQDGRVRCEQEVGTGARRLRRAAARGRDGQGGPQPAALSLGAGEAARAPQAGRRERAGARASRGSRWCKLTVPPGRGRQAELLGEGPAAAPAVVDLFQKLGVA